MNKKILFKLIVLTMICTIGLQFNVAHAKNMETYNFAQFRFVDVDGNEINNVDCQIYMYDSNGNILELGNVLKDKNGLYSVSKSITDFSKISTDGYFRFNLKAFASGKRLISYDWSEKSSNLENGINKLTINKVNELIMANSDQVETYTKSLGSGIFRTRMTYSEYFNSNVKVGELHFVENLYAKFSYETSSYSTITTAIKYSGGSWTANFGSTTVCGGTTSGSIDNRGLANSCYMLAPHRFVRECWVREEEDVDIPGLWHVVDSWEEAKAVSYLGGIVPGTAVSDYDGQTPQGREVLLKYGATRKECMSGSVTYSAGWTYNGASMKCESTYGSSSELYHENDDALGVEYTVFSPDDGRDIWYATRTK